MAGRSLIATSAALLAAAGSHAAPRWLPAAERQTLDRAFGGARPVHTYLIPYTKKVAVVWVFDRVVVCGACSAPSNALLPRGRVLRVSFDRHSHAPVAGEGIRFCEVRGSQPPLADCLRR